MTVAAASDRRPAARREERAMTTGAEVQSRGGSLKTKRKPTNDAARKRAASARKHNTAECIANQSQFRWEEGEEDQRKEVEIGSGGSVARRNACAR